MQDADKRQVRLRWTGEGLAFLGGPDGGVESGLDSDGKVGHSPMEALLMAVAGCMAVDVLMILEKSRVPVEAMEVESIGVRAPSPPKRFVSLELIYRLAGPTEEHRAKLDRAVQLSRDKYCSVLHTLDPELPLEIRVELSE